MFIIKDYNNSIKISPDNYQISDIYFYRGISKKDTKDYYGALTDFSKVIELDNTFSDAYEQRGKTKEMLQDFDGALSDYTKAINIDSNNEIYYGSRGSLYYKKALYKEAIIDFNYCININPSNPLSLYQKAQAEFAFSRIKVEGEGVANSADNQVMYDTGFYINDHIEEYFDFVKLWNASMHIRIAGRLLPQIF